MKHTSALKPQKAYITRRADFDNSVFVQKEAAVLAFQNGDLEEMSRRTASEQSLKAKRRRHEVRPLPAGIIRELGPRDAISNMLKDRYLEERHGRTALQLRDYMAHRNAHFTSGSNCDRVDGGKTGDLYDRYYVLERGSRATAAGQATLPSENFIRPITGLVCGHVTLLQAGRQIGGDTTKCKQRVKEALRRYLEAAEPFFGGS